MSLTGWAPGSRVGVCRWVGVCTGGVCFLGNEPSVLCSGAFSKLWNESSAVCVFRKKCSPFLILSSYGLHMYLIFLR